MQLKKSLGLKLSARRIVRPTRRPAARLGQNFLIHPRIAERIADTAQLPLNATVLEIGPGRGILTQALLARAGHVIAVEADAELVAQLRVTFENEIADGHLELVHADIRTLDFEMYLNSRYSVKQGTRVGENEYQVVANIPYYLTGELFRMLLESEHQPASITFLVQKEVAERIARSGKPHFAKATRGKESILSLSVKAYGEPKYEFTVKRGAFIPAPNVDSAVLSIREISRRNFATRAQELLFFKLIHAGFAHKRKFVRSNLKELNVDPLLLASVPPKARAEDITLSVWLALSTVEGLAIPTRSL